MTAMETDDLAVVTGPLVLSSGSTNVFFEPGEVVRVVIPEDFDGDALAISVETGMDQYIAASSLTPLSDSAWGDLLDDVTP